MDNLLQFFEQHQKLLAVGITLLLVGLLSISIANTLGFVLEAMNPPSLEVAPAEPAPASRYSGPKVSELDLFGKYEENPAQPQVVDAPETKLNLELQGVFLAEDENLSTAIVAQKSKPGELFSIGDRLPGNATLAAVHADHVLIRRGTALEKLAFSDSPLRFVPSTNAANAPATDQGAMESGLYEEGAFVDEGMIIDDLPDGAVPVLLPEDAYDPMTAPNTLREALLHYRDLASRDPTAAMAALGISPVSSTEAGGYRLGHQVDQPALQGVGLQSGDVVISVNDQPVGQLRSDLALVQQLMASSHVRVEVQRGSRRFFVTVPIPQ